VIAPPAWLVTHGAAAVLAAVCAWWFTDLAHEAKASRLEAAAESARAEAFRWVADEQKRSAEAMAKADSQALEEIANAQQENDRLKSCIDSGAGCGLRVKVTRSAAQCANVPGSVTSPGMGSRGSEWAELDRDSQRAYFALRDKIPKLEEALKLCVSRYQSIGAAAP